MVTGNKCSFHLVKQLLSSAQHQAPRLHTRCNFDASSLDSSKFRDPDVARHDFILSEAIESEGCPWLLSYRKPGEARLAPRVARSSGSDNKRSRYTSGVNSAAEV
jgi:hypothetical protein